MFCYVYSIFDSFVFPVFLELFIVLDETSAGSIGTFDDLEINSRRCEKSMSNTNYIQRFLYLI